MGQNGGRRPGAGRPQGSENKATIEKREARDALRAVVREHMAEMLDAQIQHAKGIDHFFLRNEKTKQFERVEDPKMIEAALNAGDEGSYYWIFTKDPSVQAFTDLMNRAFDKPVEHHEHSGEDGGPIPIQLYRWKN